MDLDSLILKTTDKVSSLIQKPKMTEKLLSKPPFRFIHDTISAIIATTGFGEGLFDDKEKDSSNVTEKQSKIDYLDKIFNFVGICQV
jgi:TRAF3-interacting protein 1